MDGAFEELVAPHRRELHVHCYRMLGSATDADDLLQETLLAAWRGLGDFDGRSSLRTWLYRIATRRCLNAIRDAKRRPPPLPVPPSTPPEPTARADVAWLQPYPDAWLDPAEQHRARESVELAFVAALQRLPPRQTAAVVLGDVLGFGLGDVAATLDETPTATKGLLQRGRATLGRRATAPASSSDAVQALAGRFATAYTAGDVDGLVALLTDDAWLRMPPAAHEYGGVEAIGRFYRETAPWRAGRGIVLAPTRANGAPAFVMTLGGEPAGVIVLTVTDHGLAAITHFLSAAVHPFFRLR